MDKEFVESFQKEVERMPGYDLFKQGLNEMFQTDKSSLTQEQIEEESK